jgi:GNAT superfamily N-acetyltransferase
VAKGAEIRLLTWDDDRSDFSCGQADLVRFLPVLRLARLGVDLRAQGVGIGSALLRHVLNLALEQRERLGCMGVVTDAKPEALTFYQNLGFVGLEGAREGGLVGDPLPMFLGIEVIAAALAP